MRSLYECCAKQLYKHFDSNFRFVKGVAGMHTHALLIIRVRARRGV